MDTYIHTYVYYIPRPSGEKASHSLRTPQQSKSVSTVLFGLNFYSPAWPGSRDVTDAHPHGVRSVLRQV